MIAGGANETGAARAVPGSWAEAYPPGPKPEAWPWGYLTWGIPVPAAPEELRARVRRGELPPLVWTPEREELVPPWEVPLLMDAIRESAVEGARRDLRRAAGVSTVATAFLLLAFGPFPALVGSTLLAAWVASSAWELRKARRRGGEEVRRRFERLLAAGRAAGAPAPFTLVVMVAIATVGAVQLLRFGPSIEGGALHAAEVRAGEWWRFLTAPMLHAGALHFLFNLAALDVLGRLVEARSPRGWVPLTFVAAALAGGVASILASPGVGSVGASGGILGLFGFALVLAHRRDHDFPAGFRRNLLLNLGLIGALGALLPGLVDNGAHAGGFLAGLALGALVVPPSPLPWAGGGGAEAAGRAALAAVAAMAAAAIGAAFLPWGGP